jgi:NADPH:quinone reductase
MKALMCEKFGPIQDLKIREINLPTLQENEVLVDVAYAAVNFPDALMVQGLYQTKPPFPFSPGHEVSGIVRVIGSNVSHLKRGDRIFCAPSYGGFAEQIIIQSHQAIPLPESIHLKTAAALTLTYGTSWHALKNLAKLQKDEIVLVLGASGGVGSAAIELSKHLGAQVIACASSAEKLKVCKELGADHVINYEIEDLKTKIRELTQQKGCNVVYDPVGGKYAEIALRSLGWRGRHLVVGFASGEIPKIPLNLALLSERSIIGVFWGDWVRRNPDKHLESMNHMMELIMQKKINPLITETFQFADAVAAIEHLNSRKAIGKVVIEINGKLI